MAEETSAEIARKLDRIIEFIEDYEVVHNLKSIAASKRWEPVNDPKKQ